MKILSIITQLESGGAQTVAIELHREFLKRGYESRLIFLYEKDPSVFPMRDYDCILPRKIRSKADYVGILKSTRKEWKTFGPQIVLSHTHFSNNLAAIIKATGLKGDLFPVHHNVYESYPSFSRRIDDLARILNLYSAEIAVSEPVAKSIRSESLSAQISTIDNGIRLTPSSLDRHSARLTFNLPPNQFIIGNIGRLTKQKNQLFLVHLLKELSGTHLAILGEGELKGELLEVAETLAVADRLHIIGSVVHERVPDFLAAVDVFAMPSLFEGLSIAMLEAFASGTPFIGNDIQTIASVTRGGAGIVLPLHLSEWAATVSQIQNESNLSDQLSRAQITRSLDYSLQKMADSYLTTMGIGNVAASNDRVFSQ